MKLSKQRLELIKLMEEHRYTWLTHLPRNAIMRFRNARRRGFTGYQNVQGLIFLTQRVARTLTSGTRQPGKPRLTVRQQVEQLQLELAELEHELYKAQGNDIESIFKKPLPNSQETQTK